MSNILPEPDRAIAFTAKGVEFDDQDAQLLGLESPAPVDVVTDRAFEYVGRYSDILNSLQTELNHPESALLGASQDQSQATHRMESVRRQLKRLEYIAKAAGTVSMQDLFKPPEV